MNFSEDTLNAATEIINSQSLSPSLNKREDYTHLNIITIDGRATKDFDDAFSIEKIGDIFVLGIHIIDVDHFIKRDSLLDKKASNRASSIYMPDQKISMLPSELSENLCSLVEGNIRPCISLTITLNKFFKIQEHHIQPSWVKVNRQLTYSEANEIADKDPEIETLIKVAQKFREFRLQSGATHISLPEVSIYLDKDNITSLIKTDRESPARMMVAELMIMGNWLFAGILAGKSIPGIFRAQPEPKKRLFKGESDSLYLNLMQRKQLNRAMISCKSGFHSGLGLDAYATATSPIRRYYDLVTQRQLKSVLGMCAPYSESEITTITQTMDTTVSAVMKAQNNRKRYWLIKHLENLIGTKTEAIVLDKRRNSYLVILTEYMIESFIPESGLNLKPEDRIQVVIQHANARKDALSFFMG